MFKIVIALLIVSQIMAVNIKREHKDQNWSVLDIAKINQDQKNVDTWIKSQLPAIGGSALVGLGQIGDRLRYNYKSNVGNIVWDVVVGGGVAENKFIQRASKIQTTSQADGTELIKKNHIVKNDFLESVRQFL